MKLSKNNGGVKKQLRRKDVLERLQKQLEKGTKNVSEYSGSNPIPIQREYPLTKKDIIRINKEIEVLKLRLAN